MKNLKLYLKFMFLLSPDDNPNGGGEPNPDPKEEKKENLSPEDVKDLKENYVKKDKYDKLDNDYKELLKIALDGDGNLPSSEGGEQPEDIKALREKLFSENISNFEYAETALKLRKAIIDKGGQDPFLPGGHDSNGAIYIATDDDIKAAEKVVEVFQHCIDYAEGDNEVFTTELMRLTKDSMPQLKGKGISR